MARLGERAARLTRPKPALQEAAFSSPTPILPPQLQQLLEYWRSKRRGREIPHRDAIDPIDIPALLPFISLFQVEGDRFRFKLAGRQIVDSYGVEPRGKYLDELLPAERADIALRAYRTAVTRRQPVFARSEMTSAGGAPFMLTRVLLPLAGNDAPVAFVLAGLLVEEWKREDTAPLARGTKVSPASAQMKILSPG